MSDILVGIGAFTAALVMYALGYWTGRSAAEECHRRFVGVVGARLDARHQADRRSDDLAWRNGLEVLRQRRRADKYRLAWLSARRRAHRGRLLAQLLREDER